MGGVVSSLKEWAEIVWYGEEKELSIQELDKILLKYVSSNYDEKEEYYLHKIQKVKNLRTVTSALTYALKHTAESLSEGGIEGQKMKSFIESDFVGSFDSPENLSTDYKSKLNSTLQD